MSELAVQSSVKIDFCSLSLSVPHTLMSSSRSSMSVTVSPLRKVYGSCISTDRSSSSALMYLANRSMGFARPSRMRILDLRHITETRYKDPITRKFACIKQISNLKSVTSVWPGADESCPPVPPTFWNVPPLSPSAASPAPARAWISPALAPDAAASPEHTSLTRLGFLCSFAKAIWIYM